MLCHGINVESDFQCNKLSHADPLEALPIHDGVQVS